MGKLTPSHHHPISVVQIVAKRQLRMHLRKIREREYCKLRSLVPSVADKKKVSKVQVIEEAVRYIEELHGALMERFRQKHGSLAEDKAQETVRTFVSRMMPQTPDSPNQGDSSPMSSAPHPFGMTMDSSSSHNGAILQRVPVGNFERQRSTPSFLLRKSRKD